MAQEIQFTRERAIALKKSYRKAVKHQFDSFIFEGQEYDRGFAKYLLQYLESKLGELEVTDAR